jgi:hypothetical protein
MVLRWLGSDMPGKHVVSHRGLVNCSLIAGLRRNDRLLGGRRAVDIDLRDVRLSGVRGDRGDRSCSDGR